MRIGRYSEVTVAASPDARRRVSRCPIMDNPARSYLSQTSYRQQSRADSG